MKKIKLFVLALILLSGCSRTTVIDEKVDFEKESYVEENNSTTEVITPSEIIKGLEKEIRGDNSFKEEKPASETLEIKNEKIEDSDIVPKVVEEVDKKEEAKKVPTQAEISKLKKKESKAIEKFINLEMLKYSNIGISIVDLQSGEKIATYNENKSITPASIMKVITSGAALEELGANTRLETKLLYDGSIDENGNLSGNIYIVGGGDPTLGSDGIKREQTAFMKEWINKIQKAGIKSIKGDIIVIDNLFGYVGVEEKWLWEDFGTSYGQGTYGISVFDNLYTLYLNSDENSVKVTKVVPNIYGLKFENRLKISPRGRRDFSVRGLPFENRRVLNGEVPKNSKIVTKSDIPNPGLFLGQYLKSSLKEVNIDVSGEVKTSRTTNKKPKNPKTLAITKSVTIEEMVKVLLKRSDNHYTEHLYQLLKLKGVDIEEFWKSKGIDTKALVMWDGSGLSRGDSVSAEILTEILVYMYKNYPKFVELLPRGGYQGTVSDFLEPEVFDGVVRVKSGSMSGIQSYTGYVTKDGKEFAFTIIVNHWNGSRNRLKDEMEKLIINLF